VRITSIEYPEEGRENDGMQIEAVEWPVGVGTAFGYATQESSGTGPDLNADPGNVIAPIVFDISPLYTVQGTQN